MKATELKIGDWVAFADVPVKVKEVKQDGVCIDLSCFDNGRGEQGNAEFEDLSPIPITKEMLEKNGWQWDEDDWVFFCEFCPHVYLAPSGKGFNVVDATGEQLGRINAAVHELQHLLWALGMDDNLKI